VIGPPSIRGRQTRFIVVRHGETRWNVEARIQGQQDSPLTEEGIAQAEALAQRLAGEKFDRIIASDLGRALDTAKAIARACGREITLDDRFRERHFGAGEGLRYDEVDRRYPGAFNRVRETDPDYVIPGGESRRQFHARVVAGFEALAQAHAGETVVVVTHGGVLATLYRHIHAIPLDKAHAIPITNASYNALAFDGARWTVDTWSCTLHLPGAEPFEED
jgi:2,3-bisphosphoglycerate-dependent phosphoglycerate mutase